MSSQKQQTLKWMPIITLIVFPLYHAQADTGPNWLIPDQGDIQGEGFVLRWNLPADQPASVFRISEIHSGEWRINFTDQAELRLVRASSGIYQYWVQSCRASPQGYLYCGGKSRPLSLLIKNGVLSAHHVEK